jgi:sugar/nucleoside kinase (ribokinase family)
MSSLTAADVGTDVLAAAEHLHVSSPHLQAGLRDGLAELFARARAAGTSTSLDPGWDPGTAADGLDDVLAATDVFLPNAAEACRLAGAGDPDAALADLARRVPTVVVTLGADGAIARSGDEAVRAAAPAVDPVDATGAGDNLAAGLLCGLGRGMGLAEALRLGVACGSRSTSALGGVDGQPDLVEALELAGLAEGALR